MLEWTLNQVQGQGEGHIFLTTSLTLTQFCARLKTVLFCRAYETLA